MLLMFQHVIKTIWLPFLFRREMHLVFYCPLFLMNGHLIKKGAKNDAAYFKLGLLDFCYYG